MISSLQVTLVSALQQELIVEIGPVQLSVFFPVNQIGALPAPNKPFRLYTQLIWRETGPMLFGFLNPQDPTLFNQITQVSGIGPKTALALMGHYEPETLKELIFIQDAKSIAKVPGIGAKTAQRLILDLKDKIKNSPKGSCSAALPSTAQDALAALLNLGYKENQAEKLIQKAYKENPQAAVSDLITLALRQ